MDPLPLCHTRSLCARVIAVVALALFIEASSARPQATAPPHPPSPLSEIVLTLDPAQSKVHWNVDSTFHTVHGTFALNSGTVHFNPGTGVAGGEIVVYAPSGQSGNASRDKRMHQEILETAKYPDVTFRPTQVEGKVSRSGPSDVKLTGILSLHGADHEITAIVHASLAGDHWSGTATFDAPYVKWGIKDPSTFLLKMQPVVNIEVEMSGAVSVLQ